MPQPLPQTTAELLLRAAEGAHVLGPSARTDAIAEFIGGTRTRAQAALLAASALGFVDGAGDGAAWAGTPLARVLAHAGHAEKGVVLRFQLEGFRPYQVFKTRLIAGEHPRDAARQTCLAADLDADALDVEETLLNWGTYCGGLEYGEQRRLVVVVDDLLLQRFLEVQETVLAQRDGVQAHIVRQLGVEAAAFATGEVLDFLVDSYVIVLGGGPYDHAVFQLGKGVETWIRKLADLHPPVTFPSGVSTMGAMAQHLRAEKRISSKHQSILLGIIAVRNAADHATDPDIGAVWGITKETAVATTHLTWSLMRSYFAARAGSHAL